RSLLWCPPRLVSRYYRYGQHGHTTGHLRDERTKTPTFTEIDNLEPIPRRSGSIPLFHDTCPSSGRTMREDPQWPQIESPTYLLVVGKKSEREGRGKGPQKSQGLSSVWRGQHVCLLVVACVSRHSGGSSIWCIKASSCCSDDVNKGRLKLEEGEGMDLTVLVQSRRRRIKQELRSL
ncbi:hypothetical protein CCMA1212_005541, partial [Trichoderma ghanense]